MIGNIAKLMDKGYGFINTENGESLFFHGSDCAEGYDDFDELSEGAEVEFEVADGRDGKPKAVNVRLVD